MHLGCVGEPGTNGVDMGIDQPGNDGPAREIDGAGAWPRERADGIGCAERRDLAVAHRQRLGGRCAVLDDPAVDENRVGGLRERRAREPESKVKRGYTP